MSWKIFHGVLESPGFFLSVKEWELWAAEGRAAKGMTEKRKGTEGREHPPFFLQINHCIPNA